MTLRIAALLVGTFLAGTGTGLTIGAVLPSGGPGCPIPQLYRDVIWAKR
jgi:hypothetical protein